jgi:hypothetical protein
MFVFAVNGAVVMLMTATVPRVVQIRLKTNQMISLFLWKLMIKSSSWRNSIMQMKALCLPS